MSTEPSIHGGEEPEVDELSEEYQQHHTKVLQYVTQNPSSNNTTLFSYLALLNAYIPESYLLMYDCLKILGPPDPIDGGPLFNERMEPFTFFIRRCSENGEHVCLIHRKFAKKALQLLAVNGISPSTIGKNLIISFSELYLVSSDDREDIIEIIKDLLTKRENGEDGRKEKFSRLIEDLREQNFNNALRVLETASDKFNSYSIFPQTISRLYYYKPGITGFEKAEEWAKKAIERAPISSYVADTLGQVHKRRLIWAQDREEIIYWVKQAIDSFEEVERKAENEEGPEMEETGFLNISESFNNRGLFGFLSVAKIAFARLNRSDPELLNQWNFGPKVQNTFEFFEWYLNYSKPDENTFEPYYFWKDVARCYKDYMEEEACQSTSFPSLLDRLNHGLFTSKCRRAWFQEAEKTVSDLEELRDRLKTDYEENDNSIEAANRYILSNIILSNKKHDSAHLTPVTELKTIIRRFLDTADRDKSPEFYLLVLMLFWPEREARVLEEDEGEEQVSAEDERSEVEDTGEEQETRRAVAQLPPEHMSDIDLQQQITSMKNEFQRAEYGKYLRGRYLLPLFFLGKGPELSRWIHKSKLDAILEANMNNEPGNEWREQREHLKMKHINDMWINESVWQIPEIKDLLLPVEVEPCLSPMMTEENREEPVFVIAGRQKILLQKTKTKTLTAGIDPVLCYLGFNIQGPFIFEA